MSETMIARKAHTAGTAAIINDENGIMCNVIRCKTCNAVMNATYAVIKGDVDGDGKLTANDARVVLRYSVGLTDKDAAFINNGDITGNGKVNQADARKILRVAVGLD